MTVNQLADKIVKKLTEAGYSYDEMLVVIQLAREKYESMKNKKTDLEESAKHKV